jgi:hypothetical protein
MSATTLPPQPVRPWLSRGARLAIVFVAGMVGVLGFGCASAVAVSPWWHLSYSARPSTLQPGASNEQIVLSLSNLGDADVDAASVPVKITSSLPAGLKATSVTAQAGSAQKPIDDTNRGKVKCEVTPIVCTFAKGEKASEGTLPPFDQIEVVIDVQVASGAVSGNAQASVSGGGAPAASIQWPVTVSNEGEEAIGFGLQDNELQPEETGGAPATQAGSHPFQITGTLVFNQVLQPALKEGLGEGIGLLPAPAALPKDINVKLPPGLVGNPVPIPRCTLGQFLTRIGPELVNECAARTAVGVASVLVNEPGMGIKGFTIPLFNLEPGYGEPARFGFYIGATETPLLLDTSVRSGPGEDYGITVSSLNTPQVAGVLSTQVTFWGVPGSPSHDNSRGWGCLAATRGEAHSIPCETTTAQNPPGFLVLPTSCTGQPLESQTVLDSWAAPTSLLSVPSSPLPTLDGCNELPFKPTIQAEPTTSSASSPSGLNFNLDFHDEGLTSAEGTAQSQLKNTVVTLPEGFTINPSSGVGLAGCTPADYARETVSSPPGAGCPNESKLGTVEIETPLLSQKIQGSIFIAQPYENPFPEPAAGHPNGTLIALYIVAKNPETGILVKLAGRVIPNPVTGQLTTIFENNPQLPFDHFNFHFREGQQAPLVTPAACASYSTQAQLTPWSEPASALTEESSFTISTGAGGGACPTGSTPPFNPQIQAGTNNNNAGAFSPFYLHLTRTDAEQEITAFSTNLPEGLSGILAGIPFCPETDIAQARAKTGDEELANPSCPPATELGHSLVGTGAGATLAYTPGKIYLAGPYNGDPFSLVSITSAVVGPFDLGTVVIRFGLHIDPRTAQVSVDPTASEPIPTIIDGIVTHVRDIRVYITRPNFMLNPTSCQPTSISSTLTGNQGTTTTISSPFQAASCANLKFTPKLAVTTPAQASKAKGTSLTFKISYPKNPVGSQTWLKEAKFDIPHQLPARLTTLQKACLAATFETNRTACPAGSIIGHATVHTPVLPVPLEGPIYFVSYGASKFPEAVFVLHGYGVTIEQHGETFISKTDVTSATFHNIPDVPFENIEVTIPAGPNSEFGADVPPQDNYNVCGQKLTMPTLFKASNGQEIHQTTPITITGCKPKPNKLTTALKACHKNKNHTKRLKCEQAARKHH